MANLTLMEKLRRKHKTPTAEVLDKTPLAIIAGTKKRPQTLAESIDYILRSNYDLDAYDRLRGAEYDDFGEDEDGIPQIDENEFDTDTADYDAGFFADKEISKEEKAAGMVRKQEFITPKATERHSQQGENAPRNSSSGQVGEEQTLPLEVEE